MRFTPNGPDIPDDLLRARDEGRVVVFCGAGVSLARAGLPDFFGLTQSVMDELRPDTDGRAVKRFTLPDRISDATQGAVEWSEVASLVSADQVFQDLDREFAREDIDRAVARSLKTDAGTDRSAHKIILDIATTKRGNVQLVTTNFDRLFEGREPANSWCYPGLPDLTQAGAMNGIVYLHGRVDDKGLTAEPPGFILSSAEFGQAYLADGRATRFIKDLLDKYVLLFLGYSADDPPIRYLLEALGRSGELKHPVYAFHAGTESEAKAVWDARGVNPIAYSPDNYHAALWSSLELWAERARDPDAWEDTVCTIASRNPSELEPHERGMVAHLVSSRRGAKAFAKADPVPPGDWLYVFDPRKRLGKASRSLHDTDEPVVEPFSIYGLDSDVPPPKPDPRNPGKRQDTDFSSAWSAFDLTDEDRETAKDENIAGFHQVYASGTAQITQRLFLMGLWMSKTCAQNPTLAWAVSQNALAPEILGLIERKLEKLTADKAMENIVSQWRYLLESWKSPVDPYHLDDMRWFSFEQLSRNAPWSRQLVRAYGDAARPVVKASANYGLAGTAPGPDYKYSILRMEVGYPSYAYSIEVPSKWLVSTVAALQECLRHADRLETELGNYHRHELVPIRRGDDPNVNEYRRGEDLPALIGLYVQQLTRLAGEDRKAARREVRSWPQSKSVVFARLRLWALGEAKLVPNRDVPALLEIIPRKQFWHTGGQRDLLTSLANRWTGMNGHARDILEKQLLRGPKRSKKWDKDKVEFEGFRAFAILNRVHWLSGAGCDFSFDPNELTKELRALAPDWKPEYATKADAELGTSSGWVTTKTDHDALLPLGVADILQKARKLSGYPADARFERNDPFAGFVDVRPIRALAALRLTTNDATLNTPEWQTFMQHDRRRPDSPRLSLLILHRIMALDDGALSAVLYSVTWWLNEKAAILSLVCPDSFDAMFDRIAKLIEKDFRLGKSIVTSSSEGLDWSSNALNSSVGHLHRAVMGDYRLKDASSTGWSDKMTTLLDLPGDAGPLAIATLSQNIGLIHHHNTVFADQLMVKAFDPALPHMEDAFWSGFHFSGTIQTEILFLKLKPFLIKRVMGQKDISSRRRDTPAATLLANWRKPIADGSGVLLSDNEFNDVLLKCNEGFRLSVLRTFDGMASRTLSKDEGNNFLTQNDVKDFFAKVWPRQVSIRTPAVTWQIVNMLKCSAPLMDIIFDDAVSILVPSKDRHFSFHFREQDTIVEDRPKQIFTLLVETLPDDVRQWPYNLGALLDRIEAADPSVSRSAEMARIREKLVMA